MATVFITPNMSLPSPVPGQEPSPTWASDNFNCFTLLDSHNHSPGQGVPINPSGISINADLPFNQNNAITLRSVRFSPQTSVAGAADVGCLYEIGVDLYYNDGSGNQVRITQSGSVAGATGTITGLPSGTASAAYASGSGTFVFQQATSTAANLDVGSVAIRYPGSYPTPSGNYIQLQAPSSLSSGYAITLPATAPASNAAFITMSTAGLQSYTNIDNSTLSITSAVLGVATGGITGTQIANRTITAVKIQASTITQNEIAASTIVGANLVSNINLPGSAVQENGRNIVVSQTNDSVSLAVVRGRVDSGGGPSSGSSGFTSVKNSTGDYTVTFTTAFSDLPRVALTATPGIQGVIAAASTYSVTTAGFSYNTGTTAGVLTDRPTDFIVVGQRG